MPEKQKLGEGKRQKTSSASISFIYSKGSRRNNKLGQALWARSNFGLWYAAIGVVKMLHTDNKVNTEPL